MGDEIVQLRMREGCKMAVAGLRPFIKGSRSSFDLCLTNKGYEWYE